MGSAGISLKAEWKSCLERDTWFLLWVFHGQEFQIRGDQWRCGFGAPLRATSSDFSVGGDTGKACLWRRKLSFRHPSPSVCLETDHGRGNTVLKGVTLSFNFLSNHFPKCSTHESQDPSVLAWHTRSFMSWLQHSFPASSPTAALHGLCHWPHQISHFP